MANLSVFMICPFAKPNLGGVEEHLEKLIAALGRRGVWVTLVTYQPLTTKAKGPAYERAETHETYRVSWPGYNLFPRLEPIFPLVFLYLFPGLFLRCLWIYLREWERYDCIHAHGLVAAAIGRVLALLRKRRLVISTHAIYSFGRRRLLARLVYALLAGADHILAVGLPSQNELIALGIPASKLAIHPNWVNLDVFTPGDRQRARMKVGFDRFTVLYVGRFLEKKGVMLLAEAAKAFPEIEFAFIGTGSAESALRAAAANCANIRVVGPVWEKSILIEYYRAADVFASLPDYDEGFATVYLEAIACGTPVIATPRGCLPDFIAPEVGFLIGPTKDALAHLLARMQSEPDFLAQTRAQCRPYAEREFGEANAEIILQSYGERQKQ